MIRYIRFYALAMLGVLCSILFFLAVAEARRGGGGAVSVRGYFRKDGTYVRPHMRTAPDRNPYNNYGYPGNYNPNTGTITPGDPAKYLERYYNRSPSTPSVPSTSPVPPPLTPRQTPPQPTRSSSYWDAYERELLLYCEQTMPQAVSQCARADLERQNDTQAQHRAIKHAQSQNQEPAKSVKELGHLTEAHSRQIQYEREQSKKASERQQVAAIVQREREREATERQQMAALPQKQAALKEINYPSSDRPFFDQAARDCSLHAWAQDPCIRTRVQALKNIEGMKTEKHFDQAARDCSLHIWAQDSCIRTRVQALKNIEGMVKETSK